MSTNQTNPKDQAPEEVPGAVEETSSTDTQTGEATTTSDGSTDGSGTGKGPKTPTTP
jgi:hypothetical protein